MHLKHLLLILATALAAPLLAAETRIDLGALELDADYAMQDFQTYIATFTAPRTGVLTVSCTTTDVLMPYHDVLDDMEAKGNPYSVTYNQQYGAVSYDFNVTAGTTYVMYKKFIMNSGTVCRLTMAEEQTIHLTASEPQLGGVMNVSNGGRISFDFDKAVAYTTCTVSAGTATAQFFPRISTNSIGIDVKAILWEWLQGGQAHPGDSLIVAFTGLRMAADKNVLLDGTGLLRAAFVLGPMPITLIREEHTSGDFLSYYTPADSTGLVRLTFSGRVREGVQAQLRYGDIDKDADGEYYVENLPVTIDDSIVTVNLQGRRRLPATMVASGKTYPVMQLGIMSVFDENGNYAYADGQGSLGSYWYGLNYREVRANVVCEFTPASGSDLDAASHIELWLTDDDKLTYDAIEFAYQKDGTPSTLLLTDYQKTPDPDDATATILTIPVPDALRGATDIVLTLHNLMSADGSDFSSLLRAKYNAFIIRRATPVAGATLDYLREGTSLRLTTNRDALIDSLHVVLRDLAPADLDEDGRLDSDTLFVCTIAKEDGKFQYLLPRTYRLERGHDYRLEVSAPDQGTDYIVYHGAADPFRYSIVALTGLTPDTAALLPQHDPATFTATFDGLVKVTSNLTATPLDADADGLATTWTLQCDSLPAAPTFTLSLVATDAEGLRVRGNYDARDYSELRFTYRTDYVDAIEGIQNSEFIINNCEAYDLQGRRILRPAQKGLYIIGNRKVAVK